MVLSTLGWQPGRHEPLGAHARDGGVNFSVYSGHAEAIELCLFDDDGRERRLRLHGPSDGIFHGFLPGAAAGLRYGLRAHGPPGPDTGLSFDPGKLLPDPCARMIEGSFRHDPEHSGLHSRVTPAAADAPGHHNRPRHRDEDVLLYELHVKGFSMSHPGIPEELRGRYAALAHAAAIAHFRALGVTTLLLLPVQYHVDEATLSARGLVDYWGYDTLGFFAADPRFATRAEAASDEFRDMVHALHGQGIEVLLDVACAHAPAGGESGPTLAFRGLDHSLDVAHPRITQFVLDALRFWVREMGVDGFRLQAGPVLGRGSRGFDPLAPFFTALRQDPLLALARVLVEPRVDGSDGDQLGRFPGRLQECNGRFRDDVRGYWLRGGVDRAAFARCISASDDLFRQRQRDPTASVNFVAAHEGFTLADLVSYSRKRNEANGEDNRDGRDDEPCGNLGIEGPTDDRLVGALRRRLRRAMIATMLLAQGTPLLCAGDEIGRSQRGNNHAWCHDDATTWLDWSGAEESFLQFTAEAAALRREEPLLHHGRWFAAPGTNGPSLAWRMPDGTVPGAPEWRESHSAALACLVDSGFDLPAEGSARLLLLFNPEAQEIEFALPEGDWRLALDSSGVLHRRQGTLPRSLAVPAHALVLLRPPPPFRDGRVRR